jgi:hypothetical protein
MSDPEPLDPSLAKLFRAEPTPAPPPDAQARVLERLVVGIPAMTPSVGGHAPVTHASVLGAKAMSAIAAAFVAGGVVGGVAVTALRPSTPAQIVYVDPPAPPLPSSTPPAPSATSAVVVATPTPSPTAEPHAAPSSIVTDGLTAERDLIEAARTRLTNGDAPGALAQLQDHARRYPHGQLAEEREALAVEALVQTGRYDAARARASQLRARWPNSVFLPAVAATLESIP